MILISVSYTHLDVYKRQIEKRSLAAAGGTEYRNKLIRTERQRDFMKRSDVARRVHPVSYTHLDVYKRQE